MATINIEMVTEDDIPAIAEHLEKIYFAHEPVMHALGIIPKVSFWMSRRGFFSENLSVKAVNADGQIVGLFLSRIIRKSPEIVVDDNDSLEWRIFVALIEFMGDAADIFGRYPEIDYYVSGGTMSVDPAYRSLGIGFKMFHRLIELIRKQNLPMLKVFCTSLFTAKICEKLQMEKITEIPFSDIQLNNLPRFNVPEPHTHGFNYML